ncbi:MAG: nucleotide exchange factor GrpE [Parcubacteria group bacterium]|jgi:nucleoside triphosphatase
MDKKENVEKKYPEPVVGALILNRDGKILLAKSKKWSGQFTVFGGHVEMGETLEEAIRREVKEEAGIDVEVMGRLGFDESIFDKDFHEKKHFIFIDFLCRYGGEDDTVKLCSKEFEDNYIWTDMKDISKLKVHPSTIELVNAYRKYKENLNALNSWKRCQADFENYKKDQIKTQEEFRKYAKMDLILQILPVLDNFNASLAHIPEGSKEDKWVEGIVYIKKQLEGVLKNNNIEEIKVKIGDKFEPEIHEAIRGDGKKQIVSKVLQKGYRVDRRVIRPARVEVE